jgi:CRP/FNR family cyclic AMP-dependent transcriptional regulator
MYERVAGRNGRHRTLQPQATARAAFDGVAEVLTAPQFLDRASTEPALAGDLIRRLRIRLTKIEDRIAEQPLRLALQPPPARSEETPSAGVNLTVAVTAQTDVLRTRIGAAPIQVPALPYVVGRVPFAGKAEPARCPNLLIEDEEPFRLSRYHFLIARSDDRLVVSDLGSRLGTIVNGHAIGHHFKSYAAPLHSGENHIIAGGWNSPFGFIISVDLPMGLQ